MIRALSPAASVEALAGTLPRTPLAVLPTPLIAAPRLAAALGTGPLLVKRDDLTGFAFGGNKARLLEFLVAAEQAMRTEGLMLDPVYTAKALAQAALSGSVVFWHTGGVLDAVAAAQEAIS